MKVVMIEDELSWQIKIEMMLEELGWDLVQTIASFEALPQALASVQADLIISDIILNDTSVFTFFANKPDFKTPIVFITNYASQTYYESAKALHRAVLLIKPFHELTLKSTVDILLADYTKITTGRGTGITVRGKQNQKTVLQEKQIQWIQSSGNYCFIHTENNKYALKISMVKLMESLSSSFVQIHRAYLVNSQHIQRVDWAHFALWVNGVQLPISRTYKDQLLKYTADE